MKKVFACLPCYNEELNISDLIENWMLEQDKLLNSGFELRVVAIDDCSTDNTRVKIIEKANKYGPVSIVVHDANRGLVGGINTALKYFRRYASKGDVLVMMDGDNTHLPVYVHDMLAKLNGDKSCVIASRYCKDSKIVGLARYREMVSVLAKLYYKIILRVPNVNDYTCGYRAYTYDAVCALFNKFGREPIKERSFACMMELLYKLYYAGTRFDETGFELRYDYKKGQSKMRVLSTALKSITVAPKLKRDVKRTGKHE